jgi:hypothetical protein
MYAKTIIRYDTLDGTPAARQPLHTQDVMKRNAGIIALCDNENALEMCSVFKSKFAFTYEQKYHDFYFSKVIRLTPAICWAYISSAAVFSR